MPMNEITHGHLRRQVSLTYPAGTRTTQYRFRDPGGGKPYEDWQSMIAAVRREFLMRHLADIEREIAESDDPNDVFNPDEDLFITIACTSFEILIEVSDRLVASRATHAGRR